MLMKNMELSLKQIGTEIGVSLMACAAMLPLSLTIGSPAVLAGVLLILWMAVRGFRRLFGESIFGEDSGLWMLLPVSPEQLIVGRLLAVLVWAMALGIGFSLWIGGVMLSGGSFGAVRQVFAAAAWEYLSIGASPWQVGVLIGLLPLMVCLNAVFAGMWMLTFQCFSRRQKNGGQKGTRKKISVKAAAAVALIAYLPANMALGWLLGDLLKNITGVFCMNLALIGAQVLLIAVMYRFCRGTLRGGCDFT